MMDMDTDPAGPWKSKPTPNSPYSVAASTPCPTHHRATDVCGSSYAAGAGRRHGRTPRSRAPRRRRRFGRRRRVRRRRRFRGVGGDGVRLGESRSDAAERFEGGDDARGVFFRLFVGDARGGVGDGVKSSHARNVEEGDAVVGPARAEAAHAREVLKVSRRRTSACSAMDSQSSLRKLLEPLRDTPRASHAALTILRPSVLDGVVKDHARPARAWRSTASQPAPPESRGYSTGTRTR